jgi:hypothetical protein
MGHCQADDMGAKSDALDDAGHPDPPSYAISLHRVAFLHPSA